MAPPPVGAFNSRPPYNGIRVGRGSRLLDLLSCANIVRRRHNGGNRPDHLPRCRGRSRSDPTAYAASQCTTFSGNASEPVEVALPSAVHRQRRTWWGSAIRVIVVRPTRLPSSSDCPLLVAHATGIPTKVMASPRLMRSKIARLDCERASSIILRTSAGVLTA
jgi:hypothetical protein